MSLTPRPYQEVGRDWLASRHVALLADQMRVGKSPQAILAADKIGAQNVLVLCPAIAVPQWQTEFLKWESRITPVVASYDYAVRHKAEFLCDWDVVIGDECHYAKNPTAQRTKLLYGKDGPGARTKRLWALSGTPVTKHAGELWAIGHAFGYIKATYDDFLWHYCRMDPATFEPVGTKEQHAPELNALVAKFMLRRTRKEVAPDMPEIEFDFLNVAGKAPDGYDLTLDDDELMAWMEANKYGAGNVRVATALAKTLPLANEITFALENGLLDQTVVFGFHKEPLSQVAQMLAGRGIRVGMITGATSPRDRADVQREFEDGRLQVIVANIIAAGTAISLASARHGYFLELDWLPANNAQAASRLMTMSRKDPVTFDVVSWPGSFDDRLQRILIRRVKELALLY